MDQPSPPAGERGRVEDPMSADRRTLVVAAVAMVVLVLVGVVSAAIFTRSACDDLVPDPQAAPASSGSVEQVLAEALADVADAERHATVDRLGELLGSDGAVVGATDVGDAERLVAAGGRLVATGGTTTSMAAGPDEPVVAASLGDDARMAGDGDTLYAVALVNELTDQVDAVRPVSPVLEAGDCTDTATVGVPLAFHLDADRGELLLFRVDDDADDPHLELRGPGGPVWDAEVTLGSGPPGVLAERLTARMGEDVLVTARRSLADEEAPALAAHAREDGRVMWTLTPADLVPHAPSGEGALVPTVVAVESDVVLVALGREGEGPEARLLVGVDPDDGSVAWTSDLGSDGTPHVVGELDGDLVLHATRQETVEVVTVDRATGDHAALHAGSGTSASATIMGGEVLAATDGGLVRLRPDHDDRSATVPLGVADLAAHDGMVAVLVRSDDGGAVLWLELGDTAP